MRRRLGIALAGILLLALTVVPPRDVLAEGPLALGTYLGGTLADDLIALGLDDSGNVYVIGSSSSSDFPTVPLLPYPPPPPVTFVGKLDPSGSTLLSSVTLTGFTDASFPVVGVTAAAVDRSGNVYLTGVTFGGLPVVNAAQPTPGGGADAFVAKIDPAGALVFSTYLGGGDWDQGYAIAVDDAGRVHVVGTTSSGPSSPFPVKSAVQPTYGGNVDTFVAQFDAAGVLQYATYLGGDANDTPAAVTTNASGDTWVAGTTSSATFPTTPHAWRPAPPGPFLRSLDAGDTWSPSTAPPRELSVTALAVDPATPTIVYAGTALPKDLAAASQTGGGAVYRSTDAGSSWTRLYRTASPSIGIVALAVDPGDPATVYAATTSGTFTGTVLGTRDGGEHWTIANIGLPGTFVAYDLVVDPHHPGTVYAALSGPAGSGLYRTDDNADHWSPLALPQPDAGLGVDTTPHLALDPSDSRHLVAGSGQHLMQSFDRGQTWTVDARKFGECSGGMGGPFCSGITVLALDPTNPQVIYVAGTFGFAKTTNGGQDWELGFGCLTDAQKVLVDPLHPTTLYGIGITQHSGSFPTNVARSTDGGASWAPLPTGPFVPQALALGPDATTRLYLGFRRDIDEGFVTRLDVSGTPVFSTYGPTTSPYVVETPPGSIVRAHALDVDAAGNVYLPAVSLGPTGMPRFAVPAAIDPATVAALRIDAVGRVHVLGQRGNHAFVAEFDPAEPDAAVCSLLVGTGVDVAAALVPNAAGDTYVGLTTGSTDLAVPGAFQLTNAGSTDSFVGKLAAGVGGPLTNCVRPITTTTTLAPQSCTPGSVCGSSSCGDGLAGARCRIHDLMTCPLCGDEVVAANVQAFVGRKLAAAQASLATATTADTTRRRHHALRRARRKLLAIKRKTRRAWKHRVSSSCDANIRQNINALRQMLTDAW